MKKIIDIRKALKTMSLTLALSMALSGCSIGNKTNTNVAPNESSYEVETDIDVESTEEHTHEEKTEIEETEETKIEEKEENVEVSQETIDESERKEKENTSIDQNETKEEVSTSNKTNDTTVNTKGMYDEMGKLIIPDLSIQYNSKQYTSFSIVAALRLAGYNSSREYRDLLAEHFNIPNYQGLAEQNVLLLDYLRHPEYFLGQDDVSHNDDEIIMEEQRRQLEEEQKRIIEELKRRAEERRKKIEEQRRQQEEERRRQEEEQKRREEEERRRQQEEDNRHHNDNDNNNNNNNNGNENPDIKDEEEGKWIQISSVYEDIDENQHREIKRYQNSKTGEIKKEPQEPENHFYDDDKCKYCNHEKKKEDHKYTGSVSYVYQDKDDTEHTILGYQYCETHKKDELVSTKTEKHTPGEWKVNPENPNEEIQVCLKDGCEHIINRRPVQTDEHKYTGSVSYVYQDKDDTEHTILGYQYCETHKKDELVSTKTEKHTPGEWKVNPENPSEEIKVCLKDGCGHIIDTRCRHQDTEEKIEYTFVDANNHTYVVTIYCNDCKKVIETKDPQSETHTPTSSTTSAEKGTADENGHYTITTNHYDCCKHDDVVKSQDKVAHGDEGRTQVGDISYEQTTKDGKEGHIATIKYKYNDCGYEFTETLPFEECANKGDGYCECGRDKSHIHNYQPVTPDSFDKTKYCSVTKEVCSNPGCSNPEKLTYVEHGNFYRDYNDELYGDSGYDTIRCGKCDLRLDPIAKEENYNGTYGSFESHDKLPEESIVTTPTADNQEVSSTDVQTYDLFSTETTFVENQPKDQQSVVVVNNQPKDQQKDVEEEYSEVNSAEIVVVEDTDKEIVVEEKKEVENTSSQLYNEYMEAVEEYENYIASTEQEYSEEKTEDKGLVLEQK